jgi:hypothetical protein
VPELITRNIYNTTRNGRKTATENSSKYWRRYYFLSHTRKRHVRSSFAPRIWSSYRYILWSSSNINVSPCFIFLPLCQVPIFFSVPSSRKLTTHKIVLFLVTNSVTNVSEGNTFFRNLNITV